MQTTRPTSLKVAVLVLVFVLVLTVTIPLYDIENTLGFFQKRTYLVALQDNTELRSTGGFLALIGLIEVESGRVANLTFYDLRGDNTTVDGPPGFIDFYRTNIVSLYDLNVQYAFRDFAPLLTGYFQTKIGKQVDGVIAVDMTALQGILRAVGPMKVRSEVITDLNVVHRLHYYSEVYKGNSPWRAGLIDFLRELGGALTARVNTADVNMQRTLINTFFALAETKHILLSVNDDFLFTAYRGELKRPLGDYVYVVDANVGALKSDFNVDRSLDYHVTIRNDAGINSNLTATYVNDCWWNYTVFTTVLLPASAEHLFVKCDEGSLVGPTIAQWGDYKTVSSWVLVPPNTTAHVYYHYSVPSIIEPIGRASLYNLDVQKQPGVLKQSVNVSVTLPENATIVNAKNTGVTRIERDVHTTVTYVGS